MNLKKISNQLLIGRKGLAIFVLTFFVLILTACGNQQATENVNTHYNLPDVVNKYSEEDILNFTSRVNRGQTNRYEGLVIRDTPLLQKPAELPSALFYDSGIDIPYPEEGVKGLYLTTDNLLDDEYFDYIVDYIDQTALNTVVIDFKDDYGQIIPSLETDNPLIQAHSLGLVDLQEKLKVFEEKGIYPIARIVAFKDYMLSDSRPDLSFHDINTGEIWQDDNGAQFINPFSKEVWDYNIQISIEAAKMGFKDIQFDYVRFPEGFNVFADNLDYDIGDYGSYVTDDAETEGGERVMAINDFLEYARDQLAPYGVKISADIFGYTAVAGDAPDVRGIGQNFAQMAEHVDAVSSMIYPSHWGEGFFGIQYPDLNPFEAINEYMYSEEIALSDVSNPIITRPWLQDFTAWYMIPGTFQEYGAQQVQEQIVALQQHGVYEFLLWNASGDYSEGVDYAPEITGSQFYY